MQVTCVAKYKNLHFEFGWSIQLTDLKPEKTNVTNPESTLLHTAWLELNVEPSVGGKYNLRDVDLPSTAGRASVQNYLFFKHEASMAVAESARTHTHTQLLLSLTLYWQKEVGLGWNNGLPISCQIAEMMADGEICRNSLPLIILPVTWCSATAVQQTSAYFYQNSCLHYVYLSIKFKM